MASLSQIEANRRNAKKSTGARTPAGKATVARNGMTHGLSANKFALLPWEDPAEWEALLSSVIAEHQPSTPTEDFLVTEMARAQWKINRVAHIEQELLAGEHGASNWSELADKWSRDCAYYQQIQKLERYEASLRRAWYKALNTLMKLRSAATRTPKPVAEPPVVENDKANPIEEAPDPQPDPQPDKEEPSTPAPAAAEPGVSRLDRLRAVIEAAADRLDDGPVGRKVPPAA